MGYKLYDLLSVPKNASLDDIKKSYKKLAVQHHPDKGGDPEKFKEIANAYQILSDEEQRKRYDMLGDEQFEQSGNMPSHVDPSAIFEQFFGRGGFDPFASMFGGGSPFGFHQSQSRGPRKCRNVRHVIHITNKDAYFGCDKHIKITLHKKCLNCLDSCNACQGRGEITEMQRMGPFTSMMTRACGQCQGSGQTQKSKSNCDLCNGKCEIIEEKKVDIHIPEGVETGNQILAPGLGEQPQQQGDIAGDLIFEILVQPDKIFERRGLDLVHRISVTFKESILGKTIIIPHYEKECLIDSSSLGILQPNKEYSVPEKGMIKDKQKGKLILVFDIQYPKKVLTDKDKELFLKAFENYMS